MSCIALLFKQSLRVHASSKTVMQSALFFSMKGDHFFITNFSELLLQINDTVLFISCLKRKQILKSKVNALTQMAYAAVC